MKRVIIGLFALIVLGLPQLARAQQFNAKFRYTAKFTCGEACGEECRLGVVGGHYNTAVNILAVRDRTDLAYRATALISDIGASIGVTSGFSTRLSINRDEGAGLVCRDIKNVLGGGGNFGFVEGFVNIYSNNPLDVVSVLTAEGEGGVSTMEVVPAKGRPTSLRVAPLID